MHGRGYGAKATVRGGVQKVGSCFECFRSIGRVNSHCLHLRSIWLPLLLHLAHGIHRTSPPCMTTPPCPSASPTPHHALRVVRMKAIYHGSGQSIKAPFHKYQSHIHPRQPKRGGLVLANCKPAKTIISARSLGCSFVVVIVVIVLVVTLKHMGPTAPARIPRPS